MEQIFIKTDITEFSILVREIPTLLKEKGKCIVIKDKYGKYTVTNIQLTTPSKRIEAIGFKDCDSMINNVCYQGNKRLGRVENIPPLLGQIFIN